jgi:tetratricopeptide (TPR) repeat protein
MTWPADQYASISSSFVGRERELAALREALSAAGDGHGSLLLLTGEPGIGKTRIAEEIAQAARQAGVRTLWGACSEDGGAPAYWPWVPILRELRQVDGAAAGADSISVLLHELSGEDSAAVAAAGAPAEERRFLLFDAVARALQDAACGSGLLIVLDDLHAAGIASLQLLASIAPSLRGSRILIVATYRDVDLERRPDAARLLAAAGRHGKRLQLDGLTLGETRRLIQIVRAAPVSDVVAADVHRRTEGNPLFVDEIARWMSRGEERRELDIPPGVRAVIRERLAPLSFDCRTLLGAAAVIGRDFDLATLGAIGAPGAGEMLALLRQAFAAELIVAVPGALGRYRFAHILTRDVLYDDMKPAERARLHAAAGAAIESLQAGLLDDHLSELAHHFGQAALAGAAAKAVEYAVRAGERAAAQLAYEDAAGHFEQALEALALCPADPFRRCEIELALAEARSASGEPRARQSFQRVAGLARALLSSDRARAARLLAAAAIGIAERGLGLPQPLPDPEVRELLGEGLRQLGDGDAAAVARIQALLAMEHSLDAGDERCIVLGSNAIAMARRLGDSAVLSAALSAHHFVLWRRHRVEECLEVASQIVDVATRSGDQRLEAQGRGWRLVDWMTMGETLRFEKEIEQLTRVAAVLRQPRYQWVVANYRAMRALWAGRWAEAEELAMQALALGERTGDPNATAPPLLQLFLSRRERGQLAGEELKIRFFMERHPESPSPRTLLALTMLDLGNLAEARNEFDRLASQDFADLQREHRIGVLPWLTEVCAAIGDRPCAELLYAQIEPYAHYNMPIGPAAFAGSGFHYLGLLADTLGQASLAAEHFDAAVRENERMRGEPWAAWSRCAGARQRIKAVAELGRSALDEAESMLRRARQTATHLGMTKLQGEVDAAFRQLQPLSTHAEARASNVVRLHARRTVDGRAAGAAAVGAAPEPEQAVNVFRLDGQFWSVGRPTRPLRLKNAKGLEYIRRLLQQPNVAVHVLDLTGTPAAASPQTEAGTRQEGLALRSWKQGETPEIDQQARSAYRERLRDLRADLLEAQRNSDVGRTERLRNEIDFLTDELARSAGFGTRQRPSTHAERARLNVTRAIKAVVRRIAEGDSDLGRYLDSTIRTGMFCSYEPDPRFPIRWTLG